MPQIATLEPCPVVRAPAGPGNRPLSERNGIKMKYAHKAIALSLALILAAPMIQLISAAPAAAGNWTASTPDNGNGSSIAASGSSTETVNADGSVTTCTESTTVFTSLKTGQVVQTIKRKRCITKKGKLPNQQVLHLTSAEVT